MDKKTTIDLKKIKIFQTNMEDFLDAGLRLMKVEEEESTNIKQLKKQIKKNIQNLWGKKEVIFIKELVDEKSQEIINKWYEDIFSQSQSKNSIFENYEKEFQNILISFEELWKSFLDDNYFLNQNFYESFHYTYEAIEELFDLNRTLMLFMSWLQMTGINFSNPTEKNDILANFYCRKFSLIEKMLFEASSELFSKQLQKEKNGRDRFGQNNVYDLLFNELLKERIIKGNKFVHYNFYMSEEKLIKNEIEYIKRTYYDSGLFYILRQYRNNLTHSFGAGAKFYDRAAYITEEKTMLFIRLLDWLIIYIAINLEEKIKIMKT